MTRLALIRLSDSSIASAPHSEGSSVTLPGVGQVSPALAGWEGGGEITYDYAANEDTAAGVLEYAIEGPAQYRLVNITDFVIPDGKYVVGEATYTYDNGLVAETFPVEDIPAPVPLTAAEKLAAAGLTIAELKELLGLA